MTSFQFTQDFRGLARGTIYVTSALGLAGALSYGLIKTQASSARRRIESRRLDMLPDPDGWYGDFPHEEPISLVVLGDSGAAGYGAKRADQTPGGRIASSLSSLTRRPVNLSTYAQIGAVSSHLDAQVTKAIAFQPDVAVIIIGSNDVTHRTRRHDVMRDLDNAVRRLRNVGCQVVVGTCPDLGTIRPIKIPLRLLVRRWSRQLAAAQTITTIQAGGRSVSLSSILGPEFAANPHGLFSEDRFHPSAAGYERAAAALLPSVMDALDLHVATDETNEVRESGILPMSVAATQAADHAGTEVKATTVHGKDHGKHGRWTRMTKR